MKPLIKPQDHLRKKRHRKQGELTDQEIKKEEKMEREKKPSKK